MELILVRKVDGKLIVDGDSEYIFPEPLANDTKPIYELKVEEIKLIPLIPF